MKVQGNNIVDGMICVENTEGKMTNMHIENYGNLMASAVTISCTYLDYRY